MEQQERKVKGIWIPIEIWKDKNLTWNEKILFLEIDSYTTKEKDCFFSNEYISELLGISETNANKTLSSLIKKGYVIKTKFDGRKRYVKTALSYSTTLPCQDEQPSHTRTNENTNSNSSNNIPNKDNKEKETNVSKKNAVSLDLSIVADEYKDCVNEWLAYKKERKQTYTPRGFNAFYTKLIKDSKNDPVTANAMIQKSMAANYIGVFPLNSAEMKELERTGNRNDEETLLRRAYDTLTHTQEAAIYGMDAYEFHMLTDKAREYWRNVHRNKMLAWIRKNG